MKKLKFMVLSLAALAFARPAGFCTANALSDDVAAVNQRLADLEAKNAELQKQLDAAKAAPVAPVENNSPLALLAKGAGVDLEDVRWRVQAGLDPDQAVQAALAQKAVNELAAEEAAKKKSKK